MSHPDDLGEVFRPMPDVIRTKLTKFGKMPVGLSGIVAQPVAQSGPDSPVGEVVRYSMSLSVGSNPTSCIFFS
jgi:hypothetical protein